MYATLISRLAQSLIVVSFGLSEASVKRRICRSFSDEHRSDYRAFSSFPDTSLFAEGYIRFTFRIRDGTADDADPAEEYREWAARGGQWLYGYVWFEQRRDTSISRGYMQVCSCSVTMLTSRNHLLFSVVCPTLLSSSPYSTKLHLPSLNTVTLPWKPPVTI